MVTEELLVQINGLQLAAKQWGDPAHPAIIALHGWLDNAASFDNLAPLLSDYRFIALDLAGHGHSTHRPEGVRYHLLDNVDDVIGLADALGLERFILLGHSMGAGIATFVAAAFPDRIDRLILIEGLGSNTSRPQEAPSVIRKAVEEMRQAATKRKPVYDTHNDAIRARSQAIGGISLEAARHLCSRGLENIGDGFTWRSDPRLKLSSVIRLTEEMVTACLEKLSMPVLLILGRHSFFATEKTLQQRAAQIPALQQKVLDGNHHLHLEPDTHAAVAKALQSFLQEEIR